MTKRTEAEVDRLLAETAAEYADEERDAAVAEAQETAGSAVFSVRLPPAVYDAVRHAAARAHLTPSALIRQWVSERVEDTGTDDLTSAIAALRRDVDRLAHIAKPA
ncbi:MAG: ribbon-helix-helix protein, CopG family [Pseudonocardiaceae bacterium]